MSFIFEFLAFFLGWTTGVHVWPYLKRKFQAEYDKKAIGLGRKIMFEPREQRQPYSLEIGDRVTVIKGFKIGSEGYVFSKTNNHGRDRWHVLIDGDAGIYYFDRSELFKLKDL